MSLQDSEFISLGYCRGISESYGSSISNFLRNLYTAVCSKSFIWSTSSPAFVTSTGTVLIVVSPDNLLCFYLILSSQAPWISSALPGSLGKHQAVTRKLDVYLGLLGETIDPQCIIVQCWETGNAVRVQLLPYPSKVRSFRISVVPGSASAPHLGFLGFHNGTLPVDNG